MVNEPCAAQPGQRRPRLEVADIFRSASGAFRDKYAPTPEQRKVIAAIKQCRTAKLGGHLDVCSTCGHERPAYNSCRNRHCPKCQALAQARWIEKRSERIIPTKYFHVVFTLPQELRALARVNPTEIYDLLLESAARTLLDFGYSRLHAQLGVTCVLHTWTRDLRLHPHAHCIVTGGGLDEQQRWIPARSRFLFPVKAMSKVFRGKVLDGLEELYKGDGLTFAGGGAELADRATFDKLKDGLYRKKWVVYAKQPFGGPEQVFRYLGRYTHRVGISNQRLVSFDGQDVCFRTKHGKTTTVDAVEFMRRFLLHVLPAGFVKIRHYGLVAAANVNTKLETARRCLSAVDENTQPQTAIPENPPTWRDLFLKLTGIDLLVCPVCRGQSMERRSLNDTTTCSRPPDTS
jgi:hypothetical protein